MRRAYNVSDVANLVIKLSDDKDNGFLISSIKLQYILYFIQKYFFFRYGIPCFQGEFKIKDNNPFIEIKKTPYIEGVVADNIKKDIKLVLTFFGDYSINSLRELMNKSNIKDVFKEIKEMERYAR